MLNVENILVCGHSNCGGCNALYFDEESLKEFPQTKKWLELAKSVKEKVESDPEIKNDYAKREWMTEQLNIVEQMKHLLTYPYIKDKFAKKKINILGWYDIIETGEIFNSNKETKTFEKI